MIFFSKRAFFSTLGLAVVVSVSSWFVIKSAEQQIARGELPADFIVNTAQNLRYVKTDKNGEIIYLADAQKAQRYQNENALLHKVTITVFNRENHLQKPWQITSEHAEITHQNNNVRMYGKVIMQRQGNGKNAPPIKIESPEVLYDNEKARVSSNKLVTITEPGTQNVTTGVGLIGHTNTGAYELLNHVRSYYAGNQN